MVGYDSVDNILQDFLLKSSLQKIYCLLYYRVYDKLNDTDYKDRRSKDIESTFHFPLRYPLIF